MNSTDDEHRPSIQPQGNRPVHDMILRLPALVTNANGEIDFYACDPDLLMAIAANASDVQRTMNLGISAIGYMLALASVEVETREIPGEAVAALGWLIKELADLAALTNYFSTTCRRYTEDYSPPD